MKNDNEKLKIFTFLYVFFIFYFLYFILAEETSAQQVSLSLSPTLTEIAIKPGRSTGIQYKLVNLGDPSIVKIRILPFEPKDSLGNISLQTSSQSPINFEIENSLIKLEEPFFLKNSASEDFSLNLSITEDTPQKDYYFTLLAESQPPPVQEGVSNIRAKVSLGSNLLITVTKKGEVEVKPKISLFEVASKNKLSLFGLNINLFDSFENIPLILVVDNKGKNLIKPRGELILRGLLWQAKRFEIKPQNVLAESQKLLAVESENDSSNSKSLTSNSLTLPGFFIGSYRLSANISFGEGTPTLYASNSFFVLPIKLTILMTAVITLVLFLRIRFKK